MSRHYRDLRNSSEPAPGGTAPASDDAAWVTLSDVCDGDIEIDGNRPGLRQLARILLRASGDSRAAREYRSTGGAAADLRRLVRGRSAYALEAINLLDHPRPPQQQPTGFRPWLREKLLLLGCGLVVSVVGIIFR
jgi:hypothetical protein